MHSKTMSSSSFKQIMDRRKHRASKIDDLALVKAAAWAWYQRGSGLESRSMREYDVARISRVLKPSRYKLEAMRKSEEIVEVKEKDGGLSGSTRSMLSPSNTDNSLFDRYEIERISKELDYYIESSNVGNIDDRGERKNLSLSESEMSRINSTKKKKKKGFWLLRSGVGCGSSNDVAENIIRRRMEKQDPVVESSRRLAKNA